MIALMEQKIYGLRFIEESDGENMRWRIFIDHPFRLPDGRLRIGINQRALEVAMSRGVQKFVLGEGENEKYIGVPSRQTLKAMEKVGSYQVQPSIFSGRNPFKIYYFTL